MFHNEEVKVALEEKRNFLAASLPRCASRFRPHGPAGRSINH